MKRYVKASELHGEQLANYIRKVQKAVDIDTPDYVLGIDYDMNSDDELIVNVSFDTGDSHTFKFESWRFSQSLAYIGEDADIILNAIRHYAKENDIDDDVQDWELVTWKSVEDFDGFTTDYSLWYNSTEDYYVCIFGDRDLYTPETADFDAEFETEREAYEWFDSYGEDDIVEESTRIRASQESDEFVDMGTGLNYWYFTTHGVMPGSVPKGLNIIKIIDKPEGTYFLTDRVLTTKSLKYYDIKERAPKGVSASKKIRASYNVGDDITFDSNYIGVNPRIHRGKIKTVKKSFGSKGSPSPSFVYVVEDENGKTYKVDEAAIVEGSCNVNKSVKASSHENLKDRLKRIIIQEKDWKTFIDTIEYETGLKLDSAYRRRHKGDNFIILYDYSSGETPDTYEAEITEYSDGSYELDGENIHYCF